MNNKRHQAIDGEAKAKPKVIKLGFGPARAAGYRVSAIGRFDAQAGPTIKEAYWKLRSFGRD
jgi:hypothetical protein